MIKPKWTERRHVTMPGGASHAGRMEARAMTGGNTGNARAYRRLVRNIATMERVLARGAGAAANPLPPKGAGGAAGPTGRRAGDPKEKRSKP